LDKADVPYFLQLLRQVTANVVTLDAQFVPVLDRPVTELNPIELAILRIAVYELSHALDIPYRVVIDEALRLAKTFGAVEGFKYVNAVLDRVAKQIRTVETTAPLTKPL
jgi:N utilization substance protein B